MATVRISDELNERLKAVAAERGVSVTRLVEEGCAHVAPPPVVQDVRPVNARASIGRPHRARATAVGMSCPHPPGRRIGSTCMACGGSVRT